MSLRRPQAKLTVGQPSDEYKQEAVMSMPNFAGQKEIIPKEQTLQTKPLVLATAPLVLQRDDKDKPAANPGPAPQTPFDESKLPPGMNAAIETLAIDTLRAMAIGAIGHAHANYLDACNTVISKLNGEKKAREESEKEWVSMAIGAAGLLLGPVGAALGAKVAGPALQAGLIQKVEQSLPAILAKEGVDMQTRQGLTDAVIKKIANDRVTALMSKLTPEAATGLIGKAATATAGVIAKVDVRGEKEDKAISYVTALKDAGDKSSSALQTESGTCTDPGALIDLHSKFAAATASLYQTEIDMKAHHFMTQIAPTVGKSIGNQVVSINAYGQERLAYVRYLSDSANYVFHSWVTPDMESVAHGLNPNPLKITPAMINGHLPEPTQEGAMYGQEQILKVQAWGKIRMVVVKADKGFFSTNYGDINFIRWVSPDGEADAQVKGSGQIGGISEIDASKIKGLQKPKDDLPCAFTCI